jgi:hypothetical protein
VTVTDPYASSLHIHSVHLLTTSYAIAPSPLPSSRQ